MEYAFSPDPKLDPTGWLLPPHHAKALLFGVKNEWWDANRRMDEFRKDNEINIHRYYALDLARMATYEIALWGIQYMGVTTLPCAYSVALGPVLKSASATPDLDEEDPIKLAEELPEIPLNDI